VAYAYVAATLDFFCGLRACEIKTLQWKHISWDHRRLSVRRSKTPAGWRDPSLNDTCLKALRELHGCAKPFGFTEPEHFLFPWHGPKRRLDPTRPITSWRTAWRSLRKAAGLPTVRFHDGRHTALTRLAEKGVPDWVIRAQFGHVSPAMMAVYSHVRRKALDEAAKALEPESTSAQPPTPEPPAEAAVQDPGVTSHVTSQQAPPRSNVIDFPKEGGAPCPPSFAAIRVTELTERTTARHGPNQP
jgi:integrase